MSFVNYRQSTNTVFGRDLAPAPVNDPALFAPTRCKVIRSFCIAGRPTQPGEIVSLPWHLAMDMKSLGKIEFIKQL